MKKKIKVHKPFGGYNEGQVVEVTFKDGIPASREWRRRLRDAELDGCCEILKSRKKKPVEATDGE
jgi:hypothetical protein